MSRDVDKSDGPEGIDRGELLRRAGAVTIALGSIPFLAETAWAKDDDEDEDKPSSSPSSTPPADAEDEGENEDEDKDESDEAENGRIRWDIISLTGGAPPGPINPGGMASAQAANGGDTITLTGSGTFGGSNAVTGGGTWTTSTGSGTYEVKELVSFEFANFQSPPPAFIDNIGDANHKAANGTAVLRIEYSDGQSGVLTVGCHGPGAPPGIFEGIAVTKGYRTYYSVQAPAPGVDANRTIFHVAV